ncbi:biliverdin-producing heme oxygenase [Luteolibacter yonseiensis]|uniref:Biliverdin-producing heme oxygenase n=1 Tax=Luteolibacter yonseiensis TaxID=1144680 RepID=A0A934R7D1_9BACT|nr:biliverdin-producing heme oxygenase [Luteolibacter yonseiensis]MBK1818382.1 biliverdin-producing heme oxygenase [Luteolibacter yonseiensis]
MGLTRDTLKDHTSEAHRRLDETEPVKGLAGGTLSETSYAKLLGIYHDFFSHFENKMREDHRDIVDELGDFRFSKTGWLREDLSTLGRDAGVDAGSTFQIPDSLAGVAGCLYVVEGSTLGGLHLSKSGKGFPGGAGRFYEAYGDDTITAWKSFIEWLETRVTQPEERISACEAAVRTFDWFEERFRHHPQG